MPNSFNFLKVSKTSCQIRPISLEYCSKNRIHECTFMNQYTFSWARIDFAFWQTLNILTQDSGEGDIRLPNSIQVELYLIGVVVVTVGSSSIGIGLILTLIAISMPSCQIVDYCKFNQSRKNEGSTCTHPDIDCFHIRNLWRFSIQPCEKKKKWHFSRNT